MGRVRIDPSIIGQSVGETVPLNDISSIYNNAMKFHGQRQEYEQNEESVRQKQVMNAAYQAATDPTTGAVDPQKLQAHLAQNRAGAAIPGIQKANMDLRKTGAEVRNKEVDTDKDIQALVFEGLKMADNSIASLVARPDVDEKMVFGEMGRLVNAGAFNGQAKHSGTTPDDYVQELLSTMPRGNPEQLKSWLVQQGARVADASKRFEMSTPQYDEQNRGDSINQGKINRMTGERTAGVGAANNVPLQASPEAMLAAQTQRRNADMTDRRVRDSQAADAKNNVTANPEQQEAIAKMIANGQMAPLSGQALRTSDGLAIMARVAAINPDYQGQKYSGIQRATSDFATGKNGNTIRSFNVAISHLETLDKLADALHNNDTQAINKVGNYFSQQTGRPAVTNFDTAKKVVADEIVKSIVGGANAVSDREEAAKVILATNSPAQLKGAIKTYTELMHGQLDGLEHQYVSTTGKKDFDSLLSPAARASRPHRAAHAGGQGGTAGAAPGAAPAGRPPLSSFFRK